MSARPWLLIACVFCAGCGGADVSPEAGVDAGQVEPGIPPGTDGGGGDSPDAGDPCALPFSGEGQTLLAQRPGARRLATDGDWLYVTVTGALSQSEGRIERVPLIGGSGEEVATGLRAPDALVAESDAVFVVEHTGLWRVDLPSFQRTRLHDALNAALVGGSELVALPDALLYVTGYRRIIRVARDGSMAVVLHEVPAGAAVRGAVVRGGDLYFLVIEGTADDRGLWRVPVDGSAAATRVSTEPDDGRALVATDDALLWTEASGEVRALPFTGGDPQTLMEGLTSPTRLLPVGDSVYVKTATSAPAASFFVVRDACGGQHDVGPIGMGPGDLLHHGGILYFTSEDRTGPGYVARLP